MSLVTVDKYGLLTAPYDPPLAIGTGFNGNVLGVTRYKNSLFVYGLFTTYNGNNAKYIVKMDMNGTFDSSFDVNTDGGFAGSSGGIYKLVIDRNGKIYVIGYFTSYRGVSANYICSLNQDGTRNTTFNVGTGFNQFSYGADLKISNDSTQQLYVVSNFTTYNGVSTPTIVRLSLDGTKDTSYNTGSGFGGSGGVSHCEIDINNKLICAGMFSTYNDTACNYALRLNYDGTKDSTYTGCSVMSGRVYACKYNKNYDNSYLVSYVSTSIRRLTNAGVNDTNFVGKTITGIPMTILRIQDNKLILLGYSITKYNNVSRANIVCVKADGNIDTDFAYTSGINSQTGTYGSEYYFNPLVNKAYIGGNFTSYNGTAKNRLIKINTVTGNLDMV